MSPQVDAKATPLPDTERHFGDLPAAQVITRDSTYYLDDGSSTLLIQNTLFKIHLSVLVPSIGPRTYNYDSCLKLLVGNSDLPANGKGSDADPLVISTLTARQFRHLLLALLGRPGDPLYMALLTDAKDRCRHTQEVFIRYLDIGTLADRLHMWNLADWAQHQLELLLKSASQLIEKPWDAETVLQIATFGKSPDEEFSNQLHVFLRRILSPNAGGNLTPHDLILCVSLYSNFEVLTVSQELFGWAFLLVLSLGHRSVAWSTKLSRANRLVLYAAQAEMVKLSEYSPLGISWLVQPRHPTDGFLHLSCNACSSRCLENPLELLYLWPSCVELLAGPHKPIFGTGSSLDPMIIPRVKAQQFRHLLLALLGRLGDPVYMELLTDARDTLRHTKETFLKYLDIGYLASRLQIYTLANWAREQLLLIFDSTSRVAENTWDADTLLQLATLAVTGTNGSASEKFHSKAHVFLRYSLSPWTVPSINMYSEFLVDCYIALYKDPDVLATSKELFGWVFLFVVSLGHESPTWSEKLTREHRLVLYAAEVEMTSLWNSQDLEVDWLVYDDDTRWYLDLCCDACWGHCEATWESSFGQVGPLDSLVPLEDIRRLLFLPRFRQTFAKAARSVHWPCKEQCGETVLALIDREIKQLCLGMSRKYEDLLNRA
ncbi:unnamed protein product [Rhizoctonia solani]|uniref:BTB domain-containing protein n=1 Tax=Rhizoctonia solani TaxID=456999 RepID=A0A8H3DUU7_9AGAM|nr:unnamed protein product [Rhizoctonia solani]